MKFIYTSVISALWLGAIIPLILAQEVAAIGFLTFGVVFLMLFLEYKGAI